MSRHSASGRWARGARRACGPAGGSERRWDGLAAARARTGRAARRRAARARRRPATRGRGGERAARGRRASARARYVLRGAGRLGQNENWVSLEVLPSDAPRGRRGADAADEARIGSAVAAQERARQQPIRFWNQGGPEHRRRGLATWLLDAIEEEAKSRGMDGGAHVRPRARARAPGEAASPPPWRPASLARACADTLAAHPRPRVRPRRTRARTRVRSCAQRRRHSVRGARLRRRENRAAEVAMDPQLALSKRW